MRLSKESSGFLKSNAVSWAAQLENVDSQAGRGVATGAGGANRDRTGDLLLAKQALSQLSYGPAEGILNSSASRL